MEAAIIRIGTLQVDLQQRDVRRHGVSLRIGARAFDILDLLIRANGTVVSKTAIMDAVWPDAIVEENTLQVHIAALRKLLGAERELIKTVSGRGYLLISSNGEPGEAASPRMAPPQFGRLSSPVPSLIGRQAEVPRIVDLIGRTPVTTLVGAGGIGKTSLAVHVSAHLRDRFDGGVCFVEIAQSSSRQAVLETVARALHVELGQEPLNEAHLSDAIGAAPCLLVLDNAERVIDVVAALVEELVARNSDLRVLVTSREPLHIRDETVLRIDPLAVPAADAPVDVVLAQSAVQLFLCRARAIAPHCDADDASIFIIAEICRRLEGLPLAIELAAARVATLGVKGVASRLDDRLNLLTGGLRSALPRHQTLRATFDWSYALLDAGSKTLFRRLGVFAGTFTFDAACAVAVEPDIAIASVISSLSELADKSLLSVEVGGAAARYRMTESTRAYAMEKLRDEGEMQRIAARHMHYVRERIEELSAITEDPAPAVTDGGPRLTLDDARAAFDWAFSVGGNPALGIALAGALVDTLLDASLLHECGERAGRALGVLDTLPEGTGDVVCEMRLRSAYASTLLYTSGALPDAEAVWNRVLLLAQESGEQEFEARALLGLWISALMRADVYTSFRYATRFERAAALRGTRSQKLFADIMLAVSLHYFGEHEQARERLERALVSPVPCDSFSFVWRSVAVDPYIIANGTLARIAWLQGDPERAMQLADKCVNLVRPNMLEPSLSHLLAAVVVPIALLSGDVVVASKYLDVLQSQLTLNRFEIWRDYSQCVAGHLDILKGGLEAGLEKLEPALKRLSSRGFRRLMTPLIAVCAEAFVKAARIEDAQAMLDGALEYCKAQGEYVFVPELLRIMGLAALERAMRCGREASAREMARSHESEAHRRLSEAMRMAREHGAHMWELRATLDFAEHLLERGELERAASMTIDMSKRVDVKSNHPDVRRLLALTDIAVQDV